MAYNMKYLIYLISTFFFTSCSQHNYTPVNYRTVGKTGNLFYLTNTKDTLPFGDTIGIEFKLPNPVLLDDGSVLNIKTITKTGIGYLFKKSWSVDTLFGFYPQIVETKQSYTQIKGRFMFNILLGPLLNTTIHYVPQDTGTYIISTERYQYLVCEIEGSTDQVQINLFPDFNVPIKHEYLLDKWPYVKEGYDISKTEEAVPYYCFYVKPK